MRSRRLAGVAAAALIGAAGAVPAAAHDSGGEHATTSAPPAALTLAGLGIGDDVTYVTGDHGFTGGHVVVEGSRLYLGSYGRGMHIYDISQPAEPRRIGQYVPGGARADGPPDAAVFGKRHVAVLKGTRRTSTRSAVPGDARTDRTEFLDVTDPPRPCCFIRSGPTRSTASPTTATSWTSGACICPPVGVGGQGLRIYDLQPQLGKQPAAPRALFRGDPASCGLGVALPRRETGRRAVHPHPRHHGLHRLSRGGPRPARHRAAGGGWQLRRRGRHRQRLRWAPGG